MSHARERERESRNIDGRLLENQDDRYNVARTVRKGGRGSLDRHSWDIISEERIL